MAELISVQIVGTPTLEGKYIAEMDQWPLECAEFNRLYPFYDHLRAGRFTTTRCKKCGHIGFPPGVICTRCWSEDLEWVDLPRKAKIAAVTESLGGAPIGFDPPVILAWLDFGKEAPFKHLLARIINCQINQIQAGDEVQLVVFEVPAHPIDVKKESKICERVYYAFEPVKK